MSYQLLIGDCIDSMRTMADQSVHCCVTSPPYFGLRDYGVDGQIGLEETPEAYIAKMVEVFREVKRVLRDDGTLWVNIGDSYASGGRKTRDSDAKLEQRGMNTRPKDADGVKQKDLIGIPWMLAFALRADGWYLRQDIIWHKPNPMPESVRDRCTKAHEYVFLLSKSPKYFYDHEAVKEPCSEANIEDFKRRKTLDNKGKGKGTYDEARPDLCRSREAYMPADFRRNRRSVWTVTTKPYKGAHFATFPTALIEPCILAGCPVGGIVLDPFGGSGTTAGVSLAHDRKAVLCELSDEYAELVPARIESILASYGKAPARPSKRKSASPAQGEIFNGAHP
jgi:site-specific DNA-methyltransferase (adenine-specific)